jgi:serine/threonine protein kinase/Flp pilus assembly protein TadD
MIGRSLSHYQVLDSIGVGGMGEVYRAKDTLLERFVALKLLPPEAMADESRQRRFLQEARAASALNHPHIVTIYDVIHEDGMYAIVMELLEGVSLQKRLTSGRLTPMEAIGIARQMADALSAAHAAGIVHRDIKPANVMLTPRGSAKVLDFGIAKLDPAQGVDDEGTRTAPLTVMGIVLGTAAYMSPEQARGESLDGRTDVFSLGVVLYEMLTGRSPFASVSMTSVLHKLIYEKPQDLSTFDLELPPGLVQTVERALAKNAADRFQTMDALLEALNNVAAGTSVPLAPVATAPVVSPRSKPPRMFIAAAVATIIVAVAGVAAWRAGWLSRGKPAGPDTSVSSPALPATAYDAYRAGQALLDRYDREGYVDRSIALFRHAIDLRPDYPAALAGLGMAYWRKYREQRDPMTLNFADTHARRAVALDPQLTVGLVALAYVSVERGQLDVAEKTLEDALTKEPRSADALAARASLRLQQRNVPAALVDVRQASEVRPAEWSLPLMEGVILMTAGKMPEAVAPLERAEKLAPDSPLVLRNLGAAYYAVQRLDEATDTFQRALAIKPDPAVYSNLGTLFFYRGLYDQSVVAFEQGVKLRPNDFRMWANLADAYRFIPGRKDKANDAYARALQLLDEQRRSAPDNIDLATRRVIMLAKRQDCAESLTASNALPAGRATPTEQYRVAVAREVCADRDEALALMKKAIDAGYPLEQVNQDPELEGLRSDVRFHYFLANRPAALSGTPKR